MYMTKEIEIQKAVFYWFVTVCYMGVIFYFSSQYGFNLPDLPKNFDKVMHMCGYIPLAFLFYRSLKKSGIKKFVFVAAFFAATIYGISDEIHQLYVIGRDASVGDTVADLVGAFLGSFGASFLKT